MDYAAPGCFFVTAVTAFRRPLLGRLHDAALLSSPIGRSVEAAWRSIPSFRPWISLGAFTLMPDHVHGLLWWSSVPNDRLGSLSLVMNGMKADACRRARAAGVLGRQERLWMRSFDVRFITSRRRMEQVERYILDNPRRAWAKIAVRPRPDGRG